MQNNTQKEVKGFHFSNGYCDYDMKHIKIEEGLELETKESPIMCKVGFHSSETLLDALFYAKGFIVSTTLSSGEIIKECDKMVAQKRKHTSVKEVKKWIILFAQWCSRRARKYAAAYDANVAATYDAYDATLIHANVDADYAAYANVAAANAAYDAANAANADYAAADVKKYEIELQHKVLNNYMKKAGLVF